MRIDHPQFKILRDRMGANHRGGRARRREARKQHARKMRLTFVEPREHHFQRFATTRAIEQRSAQRRMLRTPGAGDDPMSSRRNFERRQPEKISGRIAMRQVRDQQEVRPEREGKMLRGRNGEIRLEKDVGLERPHNEIGPFRVTLRRPVPAEQLDAGRKSQRLAAPSVSIARTGHAHTLISGDREALGQPSHGRRGGAPRPERQGPCNHHHSPVDAVRTATKPRQIGTAGPRDVVSVRRASKDAPEGRDRCAQSAWGRRGRFGRFGQQPINAGYFAINHLVVVRLALRCVRHLPPSGQKLSGDAGTASS